MKSRSLVKNLMEAATTLKSITESVSGVLAWTYWIVGLIIAFTISYVLYTRFNKQVAALLVFIATVMALYYYYVKWFVIDIPWKPLSSVCPDFMTTVKSGGVNQFICVDKQGAYTDLKPYGDEPKKFPKDGEVSLEGGYVITPSAKDGSITNFCANLNTAKISWINLCNE